MSHAQTGSAPARKPGPVAGAARSTAKAAPASIAAPASAARQVSRRSLARATKSGLVAGFTRASSGGAPVRASAGAAVLDGRGSPARHREQTGYGAFVRATFSA